MSERIVIKTRQVGSPFLLLLVVGLALMGCDMFGDDPAPNKPPTGPTPPPQAAAPAQAPVEEVVEEEMAEEAEDDKNHAH